MSGKKQPCPAADECAGPLPETLAYSAARYAPPRPGSSNDWAVAFQVTAPLDHARTTCDSSKVRPASRDGKVEPMGTMCCAKPKQIARRSNNAFFTSHEMALNRLRSVRSRLQQRPARIVLVFFPACDL